MARFIFWAVVGFLVIAYVISRGGGSGSDGDERGPTKATSDAIDIGIAAEAHVRAYLTQPSTAEFLGRPAVRYSEAERRASVVGKLNAENGAGVMLTQQYFIVMHRLCASELYAKNCWDVEDLAIGDQIIVDSLRTTLAEKQRAARPLSRNELRELQQRLLANGYPLGAPDGIWGPRTAKAVAAFRKAHGLPSGGGADTALLEAVRSR